MVQYGSRNRYFVARVCHEAGWLDMLHTDLWVPSAFRRLATPLGKHFRGLESRFCKQIPDNKVRTYTALGLKALAHRSICQVLSHPAKYKIPATKNFLSAVGKALRDYSGIVYVLDEGFEVLASCSRSYKILEVVNCLGIYTRVLREEVAKWPGWEDGAMIDWAYWNELAARELQSITMADYLVCPSQWVADYLFSLGTQSKRVRIIPYWTYDIPQARPRRFDGRRKLRLLFVGRVSLIKGIQYLLEAIAEMGEYLELVVIGQSNLQPRKLRELRRSTTFLSDIPRSEVDRWYQWADVFVLPSLCEGSALVIYEALSHGLPVIATPNCGTIVADGREGFLVSAGDAKALANALERLLQTPAAIEKMSASALETAKKETLFTYQTRLKSMFESAFSAARIAPPPAEHGARITGAHKSVSHTRA